jgi:hypothetical protein
LSTKIYDAYRVKQPSKIWEVVHTIFEQGRANAVQALRDHFTHLVRVVDPESKDYLEARAKSDRSELSFRLSYAHDLVRKSYRENVTRLEWDTYSLDVTLAIYPHKGQYYLRTFCERGSVFGKVLDFVEQMPELEDFHFQNSSDRPDEISAREWAHRKRVWDEISLVNNDIGLHVDLDICSWSSFRHINPWLKMAQEWAENPIELPTREQVWAESWTRHTRHLNGIQHEDGLLRANDGQVQVVRREGLWYSIIKGRERRHKNLNAAASYIEVEFLPPSQKRMVKQLMQRGREERARLREAKKRAKP